MTRQIVTAVFIITLLSSCNQAAERQAAELRAEIDAINKLNNEYIAAVNAGNIDGIMTLYTDDAVLMQPNRPTLIGKEAIRSQFEAFFDTFSIEEILSPEEVVVTGDWAYVRAATTATVTPRDGGEKTRDDGKGIAIYRKEPDGSWKYARLIYNSDNPLPATVR